MAYTIYKYDGTPLQQTIADGTLNTTAVSIALPGKNYSGYGNPVDQNWVWMVENFATANSVQPNNPLRGQLWFNKTADQSWSNLSTVINGTVKTANNQGVIFLNIGESNSSGDYANSYWLPLATNPATGPLVLSSGIETYGNSVTHPANANIGALIVTGNGGIWMADGNMVTNGNVQGNYGNFSSLYLNNPGILPGSVPSGPGNIFNVDTMLPNGTGNGNIGNSTYYFADGYINNLRSNTGGTINGYNTITPNANNVGSVGGTANHYQNGYINNLTGNGGLTNSNIYGYANIGNITNPVNQAYIQNLQPSTNNTGNLGGPFNYYLNGYITNLYGDVANYNTGNLGNLNVANVANIANLQSPYGNITTANGNLLTYNNGNIANFSSPNVNITGGNIIANVQLSNNVTFNTSGLGDISGINYDGSANRLVSWNTVGAAKGDVNGNAVVMGPVGNANLLITGGNPGQILITNGTGNLSWGDIIATGLSNNVTFVKGTGGDPSGTIFDGSANRTIKWDTILTLGGSTDSSYIRSVNGVYGDASGEVILNITETATGTNADRLAFTPTADGYVWVVSGDPDPNLNGETWIWDGTTSAWYQVTPLDTATYDARYLQLAGGTVTGPVTFNSPITSNAITTGAAGTPGTITGAWTLTPGSTLNATYADLAERHHSDNVYSVGTVVKVGGINEITMASEDDEHDVLGVVSNRYAYLMNSQAGDDNTHPPIALVGRIPVRVVGSISKGDKIVPSNNGVAKKSESHVGFGWALESNHNIDEKLVLCVIK